MRVRNLMELTQTELESAIELSEGMTQRVVILEMIDQYVTEKIWVLDEDYGPRQIPSIVAYKVSIKDDTQEEGYLDCTVYVKVTDRGVIAQF